MLEAEFQGHIVELAHIMRWRVNHTRKAIGKGSKWTTPTSIIGWPDLFLYHPHWKASFYLEVKGDGGRPTPEQKLVMEELNNSGCPAFVVYPRHWAFVQAVLTDADRARGLSPLSLSDYE